MDPESTSVPPPLRKLVVKRTKKIKTRTCAQLGQKDVAVSFHMQRFSFARQEMVTLNKFSTPF